MRTFMLILFIIFLFSTFIYIRETFEIEGQGGKWMWMPCINNTILFIYSNFESNKNRYDCNCAPEFQDECKK